jgi:tetratricopeptide (TPR) repeat protein
MARAAVKAKQQSQSAKAQPGRGSTRRRGRRGHASGGNPNQQLFFSRLRRQAKFMYLLLAVLFAITFAFLGVGSGTNSGLDQLFSGLNVFGHGGDAVAKAEKEIQKNPNAAKGYRDLATAYEAKGDTGNAITALDQYTQRKPKDAKAFAELGGLQLSQAQDYATQYQSAAAAQQAAAPSQQFLPSGTFGTAIGTNPIEQAMSSRATSSTTDLYQRAVVAYQQAVSSYQQVTKLQPSDANAQFQLAIAAQSAGQAAVAVAALKTYLKLNPATTNRAQIEQTIKQLSPAPAKPAAKPKTSTTPGK